MGFLRGFVAPFRGAVYVSRERLWHFVLVPILLNIALAGGAAYFAGRDWQRELGDRAVGSPAPCFVADVIGANDQVQACFRQYQSPNLRSMSAGLRG